LSRDLNAVGGSIRPRQGPGGADRPRQARRRLLKVVTGDNEQDTRHVCAELGLSVSGMPSGPEVAGLTDEALTARLTDTTLVGSRFSPSARRWRCRIRRLPIGSASFRCRPPSLARLRS